jgi:hypothetical protein
VLDALTVPYRSRVTVNDWEPSFTQRFKGSPTYKDGDPSGGMWWPAGTCHVPHSALRHRLASSAQWHARTALHQFADDLDVDRQLQAAISTGTAVELMLKAYLVGVAPALVADRSSKDSVLMVSGGGALAAGQARDFRSVPASDALATVRSIVKGFPKTPQNLEAFAVRNAACHMALVDAEQLRLAAIEMVKVIDALLAPMQLNRERFWGMGALPVANALVTEANTELQHRFEAKLAAAKREVYRLTLTHWSQRRRRLYLDRSPRVCQLRLVMSDPLSTVQLATSEGLSSTRSKKRRSMPNSTTTSSLSGRRPPIQSRSFALPAI